MLPYKWTKCRELYHTWILWEYNDIHNTVLLCIILYICVGMLYWFMISANYLSCQGHRLHSLESLVLFVYLHVPIILNTLLSCCKFRFVWAGLFTKPMGVEGLVAEPCQLWKVILATWLKCLHFPEITVLFTDMVMSGKMNCDWNYQDVFLIESYWTGGFSIGMLAYQRIVGGTIWCWWRQLILVMLDKMWHEPPEKVWPLGPEIMAEPSISVWDCWSINSRLSD